MRTWKGAGLILVGVLVMLILVLPTLIVLPFIQQGSQEQSMDSLPKEEIITYPDYNLEEGSPFTVEVYRTKKNEIEKVPLEVYVSRVVASEMPAEFEVEALKAQALAARTYIVQHLIRSHDEEIPGGAHVSDTIQHQVYKNDEQLRKIWEKDYDWKISKIEQAVFETKGEILTYDEKPIMAAFFSTSNGFTENSEDYWENAFPYLRSVESPWDENSPKYLDQKVFTEKQMEKLLGIEITNNESLFSNVVKTDGDRISKVKIGDKTFTGREIREALDLKSSDFSIKQKNNHIIFTTRGYGHGVGMSQYGANGMAQEGKTYEEIVAHFYNGIAIKQLESYLPQMASK